METLPSPRRSRHPIMITMAAMSICAVAAACTADQVSCSDPETLKVVHDLYLKQNTSGSFIRIPGDDNIKIQAVRQTASIEANGGVECAAEAMFPDLRKIAFPLAYTVEPTEDGQTYVTIFR
jgi:hypothetical protein